MTGKLRLATAADAAALADLNAEVQALHAALSPALYLTVADRAAVTAYFSEALQKRENEVALFVTADGIVGYVLIECQCRDATAFTPPWRRLYIHHLTVAKRARRQGVATALMQWAESRARELGIDVLVLDHVANNPEAGSFYDHLGFEPVRVTRLKTLA